MFAENICLNTKCLRDREVACSASDRQGSNFESCVWRTVSSQSSHHPQEVLLAQFSLYVHKGGLKPDSFHFISFLNTKYVIAIDHISFSLTWAFFHSLALTFRSLDAVCRWRYPKLEVSENYPDLAGGSMILKYCLLMSCCIFNIFKKLVFKVIL